jgi:ribosomal protein L11 methyltransferase
MTDARFTVTIGALTHDAAQVFAAKLEDDVRFDPLAISINETDEHLNHWEVIAYFSSVEDCEEFVATHSTAAIATVPDVNWVKQSLQGLAPVSAGRFYIHGSHDRHARRAGGVSIEIDAATAFGTGHHGTTIGCLMALDQILKHTKPNRIFDLGCGTGVLAIAGALATRSKTLATDIDDEAVRVTRMNAQLNGAGLTCLTAPGLHHHAIRNQPGFDLIFANILARPLVSLAHGITHMLSPGGYVVLSGITRDQVRWIKACYRNRGLFVESTLLIGNWATLVLQRPHKRRRPDHK